MATLTAIEFPTADAADRALATLDELQKQRLIVIHDAATVSWPEDRKSPRTRQAHNLVGAGALGGMFWGMLFGLIFFVPLLGAAIGAGIGALSGAMRDVGIDDRFIDEVKSKIKPGTSALFTLTSDAVVDRVIDAFKGKGLRPELVSTNLNREQEARLKEMFAEVAGTPTS